MARRLPRVVATHWVHPKVTDYLKEFSLPVVPPQEPGVWPAARVLELAIRLNDEAAGDADDRRPGAQVRERGLDGVDHADQVDGDGIQKGDRGNPRAKRDDPGVGHDDVQVP